MTVGIGPVAVLIGPMGSGKSTVAAELGKRLGVPVIDTDVVVEQREGRPIREIFATLGEPAFRDLEHHAVADALAGTPAVLSLGGGAVLDARTRRLLAGHLVVFLDVSAAEALRRLPADGRRPLLAGPDPAGAWRALADGRRRLYEEVATMRVDTTGVSPARIADRVAGRIADRVAGREADRAADREADGVAADAAAESAAAAGEARPGSGKESA